MVEKYCTSLEPKQSLNSSDHRVSYIDSLTNLTNLLIQFLLACILFLQKFHIESLNVSNSFLHYRVTICTYLFVSNNFFILYLIRSSSSYNCTSLCCLFYLGIFLWLQIPISYHIFSEIDLESKSSHSTISSNINHTPSLVPLFFFW